MDDDLLSWVSDGFLPHVQELALAYVLAFPIGWNRERSARSAGIRTFPLVALASCGVVQAAESFAHGNAEAMARIIEGIITGMGFIGGGAILQNKDGVHGTATAASLWVTGTIGLSVGVGAYGVATALSVATLITLWAMEPLKSSLSHTRSDQ